MLSLLDVIPGAARNLLFLAQDDAAREVFSSLLRKEGQLCRVKS